jgi:hypothetical protein
MTFNKIYLYLDNDEYEREIRSDFLFETSIICDFINRKLKKLKYKSDKIKVLGIRLNNTGKLDSTIEDGYCEVCIPADYEIYKTYIDSDKIDYFLDKINSGLNSIKQKIDLPYDDIDNIINDFKESGSVNKWKFKTFKSDDRRFKADLNCQITLSKFMLFLVLYDGEVEIFNERVFSCLPDTMIYEPSFKEVKFEDGFAKIYDSFNEELCSFSLSHLVNDIPLI